MTNHDPTALWHWFLFQSGLPTQRAKALLDTWQAQALPLAEALAAPAQAPGLTSAERQQLQPPATLPSVQALRWDEYLYPAQLRALPLALRPALLFYQGDVTLLRHPLLYLPPGMFTEAERQRAREVCALIVGEGDLPWAIHGSESAQLLIATLQESEGQLALLSPCGLELLQLNAAERQLLADDRLLLLTPLPPTFAANPALDKVLEQIAGAAATRCLLIGDEQRVLIEGKPTLHLTTEAHDPAEALVWLAEGIAAAATPPSSPPPAPTTTSAELGDPPTEPPPTPQETLQLLQQGGRVPPALRRRLLGSDSRETD